MSAPNCASLTLDNSTPTHPETPTYGGRKYVSGASSISAVWTPGAAGSQIATCPSPWWLFANIAKTRLGVKNVGSPCEIFSIVPGIELHIQRTRLSCFP